MGKMQKQTLCKEQNNNNSSNNNNTRGQECDAMEAKIDWNKRIYVWK